MRKPWVYKRKHIKGWWCGWYEGGKRKAKALPTKSLAEHFRHIKYTQLNSDVFTSVVDFDWRHMVEEYRRFKQVEGRKDASIYEVLLTLRHFERLVGSGSSKQITQQSLDAFVLKRSEEVGKSTLNKDITNLRAFLKWAVRNRLVASGLEIRKVKVPQKPVIALTAEQVKDLLAAASRYPTLRLRVLLAVTTGLRRGDIETIRIGDVHFDRQTISTRNRKAGKAMPERPVPEETMTELSNYVATLPDGQERLLPDRFSPKKWDRIRDQVKFPGLTFQVLRKTFASLLAQRGVSTAVTQRLLEHSSPQLTNDVYTNVDPVLRQAISLLPVAGWALNPSVSQ
ncbi:tyrosine-type recombinase/integrase [Anaerobaca lacustris]|uniref:Site-specific integrase n=1 Tax=Anaerobaca lacustris TaxID=3044600 RepID=A0AAW6TRY5_9BACT|nr:site-specific integrase [Sedimentisphaerales bacterium M17dextr]